MKNNLPRLLIIEDEPDSISLLLAYIDGYQIDVSTAINGEEGFRKSISEKPDIIFLDVVLPDIDGFKLCKQLKSNPHTANIPVIFLSGRVELRDKLRGFDAGCIDYITKPFSEAEVLARLTAQLKHLAIKPSDNPINLITENIKNAASVVDSASRMLQQALQILNANVSVPPNTIDLAHKIGTNEHKLIEIFREHLGMSVFEYHFQLRMDLACRLLEETNLGILQISQHCGYQNAGDFTRAFKRHFGVNPSHYRKTEAKKDSL